MQTVAVHSFSHGGLPGRCSRPRCRALPLVKDPFGVGARNGFLPVVDPIHRLSLYGDAADAWEHTLAQIPKLVVANGVRKAILQLPPFPTESLIPSTTSIKPSSAAGLTGQQPVDGQQLWRAYFLLSFLAHAYMWCESGPTPTSLPAVLARPWVEVSQALDMPPVLVYATYNLLNWRRVDDSQPVQLGNIVCLSNFMASMDEEWFRLVHVAIEARAAPALAELAPMMTAAHQGDVEQVLKGLQLMMEALKDMQALLNRMGEKCDPFVYYKRVRQPMSGWRSNPALPGGLVYEGVGTPALQLQLYGETGAQSSIVPAFDIVLGVQHKEDWLRQYLQDMRGHMPPTHRTFLTSLEQQSIMEARAQPAEPVISIVRQLCIQKKSGSTLGEAYNDTMMELEKFRSLHKAFAFNYIAKFAAQEERGTGGSNFMPALSGYEATTRAHRLS